ncbi:MAG: DUF1501 domain-containing protein [Saprospiraceae bacterium]
MSKRNISRRRFIGEMSCAAVGTSTLFSSFLNLAAANTLATPVIGGDYKALVCVLLSGGCDTFNMIMPHTQGEYDNYVATRTSLALERDDLRQFTPLNTGGKTYGFHPSMARMQELFNSGDLAVVPNVGTLIKPIVNSTDYDNDRSKRPVGLYSHSDQQMHWQTSLPQSRDALGWGGRLADILQSRNTNPNISMNISLDGKNTFQSGADTIEYTISNQGNGGAGVEQFRYQGNAGLMNLVRNSTVDSLVTNMYTNVFQQTFANSLSSTVEATNLFTTSLAKIDPFLTEFSDTGFSRDLRQIARTIAAQSDLQMERQVFYVVYGGWDHHGELLANQQNMLATLSNGLYEFYSALGEINKQSCVTTFTISDFARTLTSNGNGSDHAWGGNHLVMGGAVNGQNMFGTYPDLYLDNNPLNVSRRGNLIPTTSTDEYFAELALWYGVSQSELEDILPNIREFYSASANGPLGLMNL